MTTSQLQFIGRPSMTLLILAAALIVTSLTDAAGMHTKTKSRFTLSISLSDSDSVGPRTASITLSPTRASESLTATGFHSSTASDSNPRTRSFTNTKRTNTYTYSVLRTVTLSLTPSRLTGTQDNSESKTLSLTISDTISPSKSPPTPSVSGTVSRNSTVSGATNEMTPSYTVSDSSPKSKSGSVSLSVPRPSNTSTFSAEMTPSDTKNSRSKSYSTDKSYTHTYSRRTRTHRHSRSRSISESKTGGTRSHTVSNQRTKSFSLSRGSPTLSGSKSNEHTKTYSGGSRTPSRTLTRQTNTNSVTWDRTLSHSRTLSGATQPRTGSHSWSRGTRTKTAPTISKSRTGSYELTRPTRSRSHSASSERTGSSSPSNERSRTRSKSLSDSQLTRTFSKERTQTRSIHSKSMTLSKSPTVMRSRSLTGSISDSRPPSMTANHTLTRSRTSSLTRSSARTTSNSVSNERSRSVTGATPSKGNFTRTITLTESASLSSPKSVSFSLASPTPSRTVSDINVSITVSPSDDPPTPTKTDSSFHTVTVSITDGTPTPTRKTPSGEATTSFTVSESASNSSIHSKTITISTSDSPSRSAPSGSVTRSAERSMTRSRSLSREKSLTRTYTDTVSRMTRSFSRERSMTKTGGSRTLSKSTSAPRSLTFSLSLTDTRNRRLRKQSGSPSSSPSIQPTRATRTPSLSDSRSPTKTASYEKTKSFVTSSKSGTKSWSGPERSLTRTYGSHSSSRSPTRSRSLGTHTPSPERSRTVSHTPTMFHTLSFTQSVSDSPSDTPSRSGRSASLERSGSRSVSVTRTKPPSQTFTVTITRPTHQHTRSRSNFTLTKSPSHSPSNERSKTRSIHSHSVTKLHTKTKPRSRSPSVELSKNTRSRSPSTSESPTRTRSSRTITLSITQTLTPSPPLTETITSTMSFTVRSTRSGSGSETVTSTISDSVTRTTSKEDSISVTSTQTRTTTTTFTSRKTRSAGSSTPSITDTISKSQSRSRSSEQTSTVSRTKKSPSNEQTATRTAPSHTRSGPTPTKSKSTTVSGSGDRTKSWMSSSLSHTRTVDLTNSFTHSKTITRTHDKTYTPSQSNEPSLSRTEPTKPVTVSQSHHTFSLSPSVMWTQTGGSITPTISSTKAKTGSPSTSYNRTDPITVSRSRTRPSPSYTGSKDITLTLSDSLPKSGSKSPTITSTMSRSRSHNVTDTHTSDLTPTTSQTFSRLQTPSRRTFTEEVTATSTFSASHQIHTVTRSESAPQTETIHRFSPTANISLSNTITVEQTLTHTITPPPTFTLTITGSDEETASVTKTITPPPTHTRSRSHSDTKTFSNERSGTRPSPSISKSSERTRSPSRSPSFSPSVIRSVSTSGSQSRTRSHTPSTERSKSTSISKTVSQERSAGTRSLSRTQEPSLSFTRSPPPTKTLTSSVTRTITPPPTHTKTQSEDLTLTSTTSLSQSVPRSSSRSSTTTLTDTATVTDSLTPSVSQTVQIFGANAVYVIAPNTGVDVLQVGIPQYISLQHAPGYKAGDMMGLVSFGSPCSSNNGAVMNPDMLLGNVTQLTLGRPTPSNWSVVINASGYYGVCAYQYFVKQWFAIQPDRPLAFSPTVQPERGISPTVMNAGSVSLQLPVLEADWADTIRLIAPNASCLSNVASTFLGVSAVTPEWATVTGTVNLAGYYAICYRAFPTALTISQLVYSYITVQGVANVFDQKFPTSQPVQLTQTFNFSVRGHGMTSADLFFLAPANGTCDGVAASSSIMLYPYFPNNASARTALSTVTLIGPATKEGVFRPCYRSNYSATLAITALSEPIITVVAPHITAVTPEFATFARGSEIFLAISGPLLTPLTDSASLHLDGYGACNASTPILLTFIGNRTWYTVAPAAGRYTLCYASNVSAMIPVQPPQSDVPEELWVQDRFYTQDSAVWTAPLTIGTTFAVTLDGFNVTNAVNRQVWLQSDAFSTCTTSNSVGSVLRVNDSVTLKFTLDTGVSPGLLRLCMRTWSGLSLKSVDVLSVQPSPPKSFTPSSASADVPTVISLSGGIGVNMAVDRIQWCPNGAPSPAITSLDAAGTPSIMVNATGATIVTLLPPRGVGNYLLCFVSGTPVYGFGGPGSGSSVSYQWTTISAPFAALQALRGATVKPSAVVVNAAFNLTAPGSYGILSTDSIDLCNANQTRSTVPGLKWAPASRSTAPLWTSTGITEAGVYNLCFNSSAVPALPLTTAFGSSVMVEPLVTSVVPSSIYSDASVVLTIAGISPQKVTAVVLDAQQRDCTTLSPTTTGITLFAASNGTSTVVIPLRGSVKLCYRGIGTAYLPVTSPIIATPTVTWMGSGDAITAGCSASISINGTGFDFSIDTFYASLDSNCGSNDIALVSSDNTTLPKGPQTFAIVNATFPASTTYYLCYQALGASVAVKGAVAAQAPFQVTGSVNNTNWLISLNCVSSGVSGYDFTVAVSESSAAIAIDDRLTVPQASIAYLPVRYAGVGVTLHRPSMADVTTVGTVSPSPPLNLCTQPPTLFDKTVSNKRRFAECYFVLYDYVTLSCTPTTSDARPQVAYDACVTVLTLQPSLLTDVANMMPTFTSVLSNLADPLTSGLQLLGGTTAAITPYAATSATVIDTQLSVANSLVTYLSQSVSLGTTTAGSTTAITALNSIIDRIDLASTAVCASGATRNEDLGAYALGTIQTDANTNTATITLGTSGTLTVVLPSPSTTGFCLSSAAIHDNTLLGSPATTSRRRSLLQTPSPTSSFSFFNLPLFSISVDPQTTNGISPTISRTVLKYQYPSSLIPTALVGTTYTVSATMYRWSNTSGWALDQNAQISSFDRSSQTLVFVITGSGTSHFIESGVLSFAPGASTSSSSTDIDIVTLVTTIAVAALVVLTAALAYCYDGTRDAATPAPDVDYTQVTKVTLFNLHRYTAFFLRKPHHPVSTLARVSCAFAYVAAALFFSLLFAQSNQAPQRDAIGAFGGAIVAVMASPFATFTRVSLMMQYRDTASLATATIAMIAGTITFFVVNAEIGALVCAGSGTVAFGIAFCVFKSKWSLTLQPLRYKIQKTSGAVLYVLILLASIGFGVGFSVTLAIPQSRRNDNTFIAVFGWALAIDVMLLEPVKSVVLRLAHRRVENPELEAALVARAEAARRARAERRIANPVPPRSRVKGVYEDDDVEEVGSDILNDVLSQETLADLDFQTVDGDDDEAEVNNKTVWADVNGDGEVEIDEFDFDQASTLNDDVDAEKDNDSATQVSSLDRNDFEPAAFRSTGSSRRRAASEASSLGTSFSAAGMVTVDVPAEGTTTPRSEVNFTPRSNPQFGSVVGSDGTPASTVGDLSEATSFMSEATLGDLDVVTADGEDGSEVTLASTDFVRPPTDANRGSRRRALDSDLES